MAGVIAAAAIVTLVAVVWLWPSDKPSTEGEVPAENRITGTVEAIDKRPCPDMDLPDSGLPDQTGPNGCGTAEVKLTSGARDGERIVTELPGGPGAPKIAEGDDVILIYSDDAAGRRFDIIDHERDTPLWMLAVAFALAVVAFGRLRGLTALIGLAFTFAVLLVFIVPAILAGEAPLPVAIAGSAAIMLVVLYLTHGFTLPTSIALLGTLGSLALTGVLATIAAGAAHLDGISDESSMYLGMLYGVDMRGLLLAGIIIGSLGVLDDVAVTQAATVTELARANPSYGFRKLYGSASRVGRAHIASVINTIVLAYAGASLPLLLLIAAGNQPLGTVLTDQLIAQEIVRSVISTLGLIAAVPITTALAAFAVRHMRAPSSGGEGILSEQERSTAEDAAPVSAHATQEMPAFRKAVAYEALGRRPSPARREEPNAER